MDRRDVIAIIAAIVIVATDVVVYVERFNGGLQNQAERPVPVRPDVPRRPEPSPLDVVPVPPAAPELSSSVAQPALPPAPEPLSPLAPKPADAGPPPPGTPVLGLPLRCEPGVDCWIANYVDMASGPEVRDYACGPLSYDGHKGTDFAIRTLADMRAGVEVIAAAPGIVEGVRDGVKDVSVAEAGRQSVVGTECGNGVVVSHGNGWSTQYCHMMQDSVTVKPQQRVAAGDVLGKVGLSGLTEFPHVHIQVMRGETVVDPFAGTDRKAFCGVGPHPLWGKALLAKLTYRPTMIYNLGFAPELPAPEAARNGRFRDKMLSATADVVVLWADIFGVQAADKLTLTIIGPDGKVFLNQTIDQSRQLARRFIRNGRRRTTADWPVGIYRGIVTVTRANDKLGPGVYTAETAVEIQ